MGMKEPEQPSYNEVDESPIVTIEDAYNSPAAKPIPPLPSGEGYDAPEVITAAPADSGSPAPAPAPLYNTPAPVSYYSQPTLAPLTTYAQPAYVQPAYGGYNSPIEEPLFQYAPVSDLN